MQVGSANSGVQDLDFDVILIPRLGGIGELLQFALDAVPGEVEGQNVVSIEQHDDRPRPRDNPEDTSEMPRKGGRCMAAMVEDSEGEGRSKDRRWAGSEIEELTWRRLPIRCIQAR